MHKSESQICQRTSSLCLSQATGNVHTISTHHVTVYQVPLFHPLRQSHVFALRTMRLSQLAVCLLIAVATEGFIPSFGNKRKQSGVLSQRQQQENKVSAVFQNPATTKLFLADSAEDEFHEKNPASTTPQLLSGIWNMISQGSSLVRGESITVEFPEMKDKFTPAYINRLIGHLDNCKDVCDSFGITTNIVPYAKNNVVSGFTVKSFRNPDKDPDSYDFDYDPFWEDDFDYSGIDDEYDDAEIPKDKFPEIKNPIPDDDDEIVDVSKVWVDKMMSDMGICPFTNGPDMSGMPMGPVFYCVDRSTKMEDMYARFWKEAVRVEDNVESELSTTLLVTPEFCMENVEMFENWSNTLTQTLEALDVEGLCQLIFFHPQWTFRDGGERSGDGAAANYARRSPWPMINILRTNQVRAAQRGIPTGLVYQQNEKTLTGIGSDKLETMLRLRNWDDVSNVKVNRRDMEALRIAQDYQQTGQVKAEDQSLVHDSTPAANKINEEQIEDSNLVNVLVQALGKRLGKESGTINRLSGPETSATIMASDFVLKSLGDIAQGKTTATKAAVAAPQPVAATQTPLDDKAEVDSDREDQELEVLFGGGGIVKQPDDDEYY